MLQMTTILVKNLAYMYSNVRVPFYDLSGRDVEDHPRCGDDGNQLTGDCSAAAKPTAARLTAHNEATIEHGNLHTSLQRAAGQRPE